MSFSKDTKKEMCSIEAGSEEEKKALIYGMLLFSKVFSPDAVSFTTECHDAALYYSQLVSSLTSVIVETSVSLTRKGADGKSCSLTIPDSADCRRLFDYFGHDANSLSLRINRSNIDEEGALPFFLRGAFLVCGNVSDPGKDYHLEFAVPHMNLAKDLARVISETEVLSAEPKTVRRKGSYVVYIKEGSLIVEALNVMEAMMCGKPVVASHNRGHDELIVDGVTGFLVAPDNPQEYAEAVCRILKQPLIYADNCLHKIKPFMDIRVQEELGNIYDL